MKLLCDDMADDHARAGEECIGPCIGLRSYERLMENPKENLNADHEEWSIITTYSVTSAFAV